MKRFSIAVDTGGTFTDFVLFDNMRKCVTTAKVLSTPKEPDQAIFEGFDELARQADFDLADCNTLLHATTLITNAVIERTGQDFICLHTAGFGTILETGREHRYNLSDLRLPFPEPITQFGLKIPIRERVLANGKVSKVPDKSEVMDQVTALSSETGITNFAICFLHSFRNTSNENTVANWLADAYPDAFISVSHSISSLQREYERWLTCAINAYTKPMLARYVQRIEQQAFERGFRGNLLLMTSTGLPLPAAECTDTPVRLIESGPAAGVLAAKEISNRNRLNDRGISTVLAFDMGGTTAKGSFLIGGRVGVKTGLEIAREGAFESGSGFPLNIPAIDLIEIGAGGGSIATIDERGAIAVGPRSAGATPGPASYNMGGQSATVTDANLALGFLGETRFQINGTQPKTAVARSAISRTIARPLGLSIERAALGIHNTINENIARAFRVHAAELGIDYRRANMVCTGGAAPIHAAAVARLLHIHRIIYPFAAGVASAFGLFSGTEGIVLQKSRLAGVDDLTKDGIREQICDITTSHPYAQNLITRGADTVVKLGMRYEGQNSEVTIVGGGDADIVTPNGARNKFFEAYEGIFGLRFPSYRVEICTWSVEISMPTQIMASNDELGYSVFSEASFAERTFRSCYLGPTENEECIRVPVFDRYSLGRGWNIEGPAIIEENNTTIFIPRKTSACVQNSLDIVAENEL